MMYYISILKITSQIVMDFEAILKKTRMGTFQKPINAFKATKQFNFVIFRITSRTKQSLKRHCSTQVVPKTDTMFFSPAQWYVQGGLFFYYLNCTYTKSTKNTYVCMIYFKIKRNFPKDFVQQLKSYNEFSRENEISTLKIFLQHYIENCSLFYFDNRPMHFEEKQKEDLYKTEGYF